MSKIPRRRVLQFLGAFGASTFVLSPLSTLLAKAAEPVAPIRLPLEEFAETPRLVKALRRGVTAMKRRKPSDPLSWFYQAAIHGASNEKVQEAVALDADVLNIDREKYWNQCPHFGENSANFLPWHRAYTYYFERILRMHSEEDDFAVPYWNYTDPSQRIFPKLFGIEHLDGNLSNEDPANINPLFLKERDFYFTTYEHPLTPNVPLVQLTDISVDISLPMNSPVFFGDTEKEGLAGGIEQEDPESASSTRGLLESYPHDQIHRAVGGVIPIPNGDPVTGAMSFPPTAAFDPIFCVHHSNIDRLWAEWSCMPGKSWGKIPSKEWFEEKPWYFFDSDGTEKNEPRKAYFDYRALAVKYKNEDLTKTPLQLPDFSLLVAEAETSSNLKVMSTLSTKLKIAEPVKTTIVIPKVTIQPLVDTLTGLHLMSNGTMSGKRFVLKLKNVNLGSLRATGFDVHVTANPDKKLTRSSASFVGSISVFNHSNHGKHKMQNDETFDITKAVSAQLGALDKLQVVLIPYALLTETSTAPVPEKIIPLTLDGAEFLVRQ